MLVASWLFVGNNAMAWIVEFESTLAMEPQNISKKGFPRGSFGQNPLRSCILDGSYGSG